MTTPLELSLGSADAWRIAAAVIAVAILFAITVALQLVGHTLERAWRWVLRAVTLQQAVLAYVAVVRAQSTPRGLPDGPVDASLIALVLSGLVLFVAVLALLVGTRKPESHRSRHVSA